MTLFPEMIKEPLDQSIIGRARENGRLEISVHDIRDYAEDKHKTVDDKPFGGGAGMVMKCEPLYNAINAIDPDSKSDKILLGMAVSYPVSSFIHTTFGLLPFGGKCFHAQGYRQAVC